MKYSRTSGNPPTTQPLEIWTGQARKSQTRAATFSTMSHLLWPAQAALVAYALGGLLTGTDLSVIWIGALFLALGGVRVTLGWRANALLDAAAETVVRTARAHILATEAKRSTDSPYGGAGSISALAGEKLDILRTYISRYRPAHMRVMILPPVILALALWQSWAVALVLLISGPLIPVFMALIGMAAKEASQKQMTEISTLNDLLIERLSALVDIRVLGAQDAVQTGFSAQAQDLRRRTMAVLKVAFLSSTVLELFAAIGVAMVAVYVGFSLLGALEFGTWGQGLSPQAGIFVLLLAPEFFQPLRDLSAAWHDRAAAQAVAEDLTSWGTSKSPDLLGQGGTATRLSGPASVSLMNCTLPNGKLLADIKIEQGERVALVGPSGAGKTTALRIMAGLYVPETGQVKVAGVPLENDTADAWRARIGWMPQSPHFLHASIKRNVTLNRKGDLRQALDAAAISKVVAALPQGETTRLGETGGGLSGGEARRLTLARAIYGAPDVILADEPTADLDAQTAQSVTHGLLAQSAKGATLILATHDSTLAAKMDRIIYIGAAT